MLKSRRTRIGAVAAIAVCAALGSASSASAATYTVGDFGDADPTPVCLPNNPSSCNLRGAMEAARTVGETSVINLLPGTYHLTLAGENGFDDNDHGDLDYVNIAGTIAESNLTINGAGPGQTTIQAPSTFYRILEVQSPAAVTIQGINFTGGRATTLADGNPGAENGNSGGAILAPSSGGSLALQNVRFEDNATFTGSGVGGAILVQTDLTIENASFVNNSAVDRGGAVAALTPFQGGANVAISNSTFDRNKATNVGIPGGGGGAIANQGDVPMGSAELDTVMTVTNSSFDGNTAAGFGGAIDSFGGGTTAMNVISSTFTRNKANVDNTGPEGSGALQNGDVAFTVRNSLLVDNSVGFDGPNPGPGSDCGGFPFTSQGGNVLGGACNGFNAVGDVALEDIAQNQPCVGPLSANGGPTLTLPLLTCSVAIDHTTGCPATDQRGVPRPQGVACDSGAFELVPPVPAPGVTVTPAPTPTAPAKKCKKKKKKKGSKKKKCKRKKRKRK